MPKDKLDWGDAVAIIFYILAIITTVGGIALASVWSELTKFVETSGYTIQFLGINGVFAMFIMITMGVIYFFTGWLVQERYKVGKTVAFIFGILFLFAFPIGTTIGIIILYTLLSSPVRNEFSRSFDLE